MATNKTQRTTASVDVFIEAHPREQMRDDSRELVALMRTLTGAEPYMYGPSIIGFGSYHYRYESGREGDAPLLAFSPRKTELVIYVGAAALTDDLLAQLGRHRATKGCLYVKKLADIHMNVLRRIMERSLEHTLATYGRTY